MKRPIVRPLYRIGIETAAAALTNDPGFVFFDLPQKGRRRFSVLSSKPSSSFSFTGAFVTRDGQTSIDTPRTALASFLSHAEIFPRDGYLPFSGGAIGYAGFEGIRALAGFDPASGFSRFPQGSFGIYDTAVVFDHIENTSFVVAAGEEGEKRANELAGRLSSAATSGYGIPPCNLQAREREENQTGGSSPIRPRLVPDETAFRRILEDARQWLRSEKIGRIHLTRQALMPSPGNSLVKSLLSGHGIGFARILFSHEGATALLASSGPVEAAGGNRGDKVAHFLSSLLSADTAGLPVEKAMAFVTNHEEEHRRFYGGVFGTADAAGFSFHRVSFSSCEVDGALAVTAGADMTAECNPDEVKAKIDELLFSS